VLADAQLGQALWALCAEQANKRRGPPIVVLAHDDEEIAQAQASGATACLQQPLPLADIVACVARMLHGPGVQRSNATREVGGPD